MHDGRDGIIQTGCHANPAGMFGKGWWTWGHQGDRKVVVLCYWRMSRQTIRQCGWEGRQIRQNGKLLTLEQLLQAGVLGLSWKSSISQQHKCDSKKFHLNKGVIFMFGCTYRDSWFSSLWTIVENFAAFLYWVRVLIPVLANVAKAIRLFPFLREGKLWQTLTPLDNYISICYIQCISGITL